MELQLPEVSRGALAASSHRKNRVVSYTETSKATSYRLNRLFLTLLLFLAGVLLTGCLVVPLPGNEKKVMRGSAVGDGQVAKVEIGLTTRKEVEATLGQPSIIWEDKRVYAYDWDVVKMRWLWMIAAGATGGGGEAEQLVGSLMSNAITSCWFSSISRMWSSGSAKR